MNKFNRHSFLYLCILVPERAFIVERLYVSSLITIVSMKTTRKLQVYHSIKENEICCHTYPSSILTVKMNRKVWKIMLIGYLRGRGLSMGFILFLMSHRLLLFAIWMLPSSSITYFYSLPSPSNPTPNRDSLDQSDQVQQQKILHFFRPHITNDSQIV